MRAVVNASPLIFLAKLDRLSLLPFPIGTTPLVLAEIRAGASRGHLESNAVEAMAKAGTLAVAEAKPRGVGWMSGLDPAEASVLQLALDRGVREVIVDDYAAIRAARVLGLAPLSTPFLLLRARRQGAVDREQFRSLLERLVAHGCYLSSPVYRRLLEAGGEK